MSFVGATLASLADQRPDTPALVCGTQRVCRADLHDWIETQAPRLAGICAGGGRVALALSSPIDLVRAFFLIARAGGVAMVFDPHWPAPRRQAIETATHPQLILDDTGLADLEAGKQTGLRADNSFVAPDAEAPFYIGFTSGSTGTPKGYCRSHRSWLESFAVSTAEFDISAADRIMIPGSLTHSLHLYGAVHGVHAGAEVHLSETFRPKRIVDAMRQQETTVLYATPTQLHYLAEQARLADPLPHVRLILISGAKWRAGEKERLRAAFPNALAFEFYGASETSFITIVHPDENVPERSVGRAAAGVDIEIRDASGVPMRSGEVGAIWVRSKMAFDDYVCGAGEETLRDGDWLTVGDHGALDESGFLSLAGREKRMIVTSGVNIYPEEVERALESHAAIASAVVFGMDDPVRGTRLVAAVKPHPGKRIDTADVRRACAGLIGRERTPGRLHLVDDWPLTGGGKADLEALRQILEAREAAE